MLREYAVWRQGVFTRDARFPLLPASNAPAPLAGDLLAADVPLVGIWSTARAVSARKTTLDGVLRGAVAGTVTSYDLPQLTAADVVLLLHPLELGALGAIREAEVAVSAHLEAIAAGDAGGQQPVLLVTLPQWAPVAAVSPGGSTTGVSECALAVKQLLQWTADEAARPAPNAQADAYVLSGCGGLFLSVESSPHIALGAAVMLLHAAENLCNRLVSDGVAELRVSITRPDDEAALHDLDERAKQLAANVTAIQNDIGAATKARDRAAAAREAKRSAGYDVIEESNILRERNHALKELGDRLPVAITSASSAADRASQRRGQLAAAETAAARTRQDRVVDTLKVLLAHLRAIVRKLQAVEQAHSATIDYKGSTPASTLPSGGALFSDTLVALKGLQRIGGAEFAAVVATASSMQAQRHWADTVAATVAQDALGGLDDKATPFTAHAHAVLGLACAAAAGFARSLSALSSVRACLPTTVDALKFRRFQRRALDVQGSFVVATSQLFTTSTPTSAAPLVREDLVLVASARMDGLNRDLSTLLGEASMYGPCKHAVEACMHYSYAAQ